MAVKRGGEPLLRRAVACARPPRHRPHARTHMHLTQRPTRILTDSEKRRLGKMVRPSCDARGARPLLPSFAVSACRRPSVFPRTHARTPPLAARALLHRAVARPHRRRTCAWGDAHTESRVAGPSRSGSVFVRADPSRHTSPGRSLSGSVLVRVGLYPSRARPPLGSRACGRVCPCVCVRECVGERERD